MIIWFLILSLMAPDVDARRRKRRGPREPMQAYTHGYQEHKEARENTSATATKELIAKLSTQYEKGKGCFCENDNHLGKNNYICDCVTTDAGGKRITRHNLKTAMPVAEISKSLDEYYSGNIFSLSEKKELSGFAELKTDTGACLFSFNHCVCLNSKIDKSKGASHIDVVPMSMDLNEKETAYKLVSAACSGLSENAYSLSFKQGIFSYFPVIYAGALVDEVNKLDKIDKKERSSIIQILKKTEKDFASEDTQDDITDLILEISTGTFPVKKELQPIKMELPADPIDPTNPTASVKSTTAEAATSDTKVVEPQVIDQKVVEQKPEVKPELKTDVKAELKPEVKTEVVSPPANTVSIPATSPAK